MVRPVLLLTIQGLYDIRSGIQLQLGFADKFTKDEKILTGIEQDLLSVSIVNTYR